MTRYQRYIVRYLFWRGHSVPHIAMRMGLTISDVESVLFARVARHIEQNKGSM
jgi:hypothetical protein